MQTLMKKRFLPDSSQCKSGDGILLSDFLNQNNVVRGHSMSEKNLNIAKMAVLLANKHHSDQKKCYKRFLHIFLLYM